MIGVFLTIGWACSLAPKRRKEGTESRKDTSQVIRYVWRFGPC